MTVAATRRTVTGHYAGPVSRAAAAVIDVAVILGAYTLAVTGLSFLDSAFLDNRFHLSENSVFGVVALVAVGFRLQLHLARRGGSDAGQGDRGPEGHDQDGQHFNGRAAFGARWCCRSAPSFFGLGLVAFIVGREHRALHDLAAHTCVVYDWGTRSAQLPGPLSEFLARHEVT